jgi:uncharacterized tellurite resistance protein B-like protein
MSRIVELLPNDFAPSDKDAEILLELAYLVTAADGKLLDSELAAFSAIAARMRGKDKLDAAEVDALVDQFAHHVEAHEIETRVRVLAPTLAESLHELAYKLALGIAFIDHDPSNEEDRLHTVLGDALGIAPGRRAAISREVGLGGGKAT